MKYFLFPLLLVIAGGAAAQDYKIVNSEVVMEKQVKFKPGTADLLPESDAALAIIKKYLDEKSYISLLRIEANVSASGKTADDEVLTSQRAMSVYSALVMLGADCKRLVAVSFGGNKPVADKSTLRGQAANTNVRFVNAALRGRLIGGMPPDGGGKLITTTCN